VATLESGSRKMDKQEFINNVRKAQKVSKPLPEYSCADTVSTTATAGTILEAFARNFGANHGIIVESAEELVAKLNELGCKKGVIDEKVENTFGLENSFEVVRQFDRANPDQYDFGVSKASYAIAESGAFVLKDVDTTDRMASIAPWVHVAILNKSDIVRTIEEGLTNVLTDTPYAIFVAGPSKTTDVEGVLVEGVHGPGQQIVFLQ
jgi:L-lactate dehydrogenase complex protein LldG